MKKGVFTCDYQLVRWIQSVIKNIMSERKWTWNQRVSDTKQLGRRAKKGMAGKVVDEVDEEVRYNKRREPRPRTFITGP